MDRTSLITGFEPRHAILFGSHTVKLRHTLADSPLFTDEALARLIENLPRTHYHANTMDTTAHDTRTRREGEIVGLRGVEVLEAVRGGRIWLLLQNLDDLSRDYKDLLLEMHAAVEAHVPGLKTFRQRMNVVVSSPLVQTYYHADAPGQMLWQLRGSKKVYLYPPLAPFLPQHGLEKIVLGDVHEISLDYHPWFDDYAEVVHLTPGTMMHWSLNRPHRVVNDDVFNVSIATEHFTSEARSAYLVNYANGLLHLVSPRARLSPSTRGPTAWLKLGLAAAVKLSRLRKARKRAFKVDFVVDPRERDGVRDIPEREIWK